MAAAVKAAATSSGEKRQAHNVSEIRHVSMGAETSGEDGSSSDSDGSSSSSDGGDSGGDGDDSGSGGGDDSGSGGGRAHMYARSGSKDVTAM